MMIYVTGWCHTTYGTSGDLTVIIVTVIRLFATTSSYFDIIEARNHPWEVVSSRIHERPGIC